MSSIEEKLWEYIDGGGTAADREAIEKLIATNESYRLKYEELLAFNHEMAADLELDEPPMAFTYHVMEAIRTDYATQHPLKTQVNKNLMRVIGGFFIVSLLALLGMAWGSINWSAGAQAAPQAAYLPDFKRLFSGNILTIFLFFDTVLLLFLLDGFMRRRMSQKQA